MINDAAYYQLYYLAKGEAEAFFLASDTSFSIRASVSSSTALCFRRPSGVFAHHELKASSSSR